MKEDTVYLNHILDCIANIEEGTAQGYEHFMASRTYRDAVLRNLQVMAESTQCLSDELKVTQPEIE